MLPLMVYLQMMLGDAFCLSSNPHSSSSVSHETLGQRHFGHVSTAFIFEHHADQACPLSFARQNEHSTASPWEDCDLGSDSRHVVSASGGVARVWQPSRSLTQVVEPSAFGKLWLPLHKQFPCGEATNPGPPLTIQFCNPTGLRGKEEILYNGPRGIHNVAETHLATPGLQAVCQTLRSWAQADQRQLRLLPGQAVPLRARSLTTGTWSGVWQSADMPCNRVNLQWPQQEQLLGRAQAANFRFGNNQILGVVIHAWTPGPTWPKARIATEQLLQFLTEQVVHGASGCRYISGDFNGSEDDYPILQSWLQAGWREVQELHFARNGDEAQPTCKGSTSPDKLYVSPELAARFQHCCVVDNFADHSSIWAHFDFPDMPDVQTWWPKPSKVPWHAIDFNLWQQQQVQVEPFCLARDDPSQYLHQLGAKYESSFDGYFEPHPAQGLPTACRGRGQIYAPTVRQPQLPRVKASRKGEERLSSDLVCRSLQRWFRQLRRIQSLLHNLNRASDAPTAIAYRLHTWESIKNAPGFGGSFAAGWATRPIQLHGLGLLPENLPTASVLTLIFEDFRSNFRRLESWNLRHRGQVLKVATQESSRKAFQQLAGDSDHRHVDRFVTTTKAHVEAIDAATHHVKLTHDLEIYDGSEWHLDHTPARVNKIAPCVFQVDADLLPCAGQALQQTVVHGDTSKMLSLLTEFWGTRWNRDRLPSESDWSRILSFARAYMPSYSFDFPEIQVVAWDEINLRYKQMSAKGPDGFDHLDLKHMPSGFKEGLVSLLNAIEQGAAWPTQLCQGYGICLPKHARAQAIGEFRPIIILSSIYRSWSSLRSRACLRKLADLAAPGLKGLPGRECGEIWHLVQALAEASLQQHLPLAGVISDVKKAFENVPRTPLFDLALHVGFPVQIIDPWRRFLHCFERRFLLRNQIGEPLKSNHGLPEGDGLSVLGMTLIDMAWDHYQRAFAPATVPLSFVDNYEVLASSCAELLTGFNTLEAFMQMWHLELDCAKTVFWSTDPSERTALRRLGKTVCLNTADLGGALNFSRRRGAASQQQRLDALDALWTRLRRASMLTHTKEMLLRQAFWTKAFYGIGITLLPWKSIQHLRTKAVRALGFGGAGAHPGIRLALLSTSRCTDPGFYQLLRTFQDFRRFLSKDPDLLDLWKLYFEHFDGALLSGPFSKLIEQMELIGWTLLEPPWFLDHDRCRFNLQTMASTLLENLLDDAWCQRLSCELHHRQDFDGLRGLHWPPSRHEGRLSPLDLGRVNALREGAFLTNAAHAKYDLCKGSACGQCGELDTFEHRVLRCPAYDLQRAHHPDALGIWHTCTRALAEHLLPNRLETWVPWKSSLERMDDFTHRFWFDASPNVHYDLFTDGSVVEPAVPCLARASWGVVSVHHGGVLACGPLRGTQQTINRAELQAALVATSWLYQFGASGTLWVDSGYVGTGVSLVLSTLQPPDFDSNEDLWQDLADLILAMSSGQLQIQHVSSHRSAFDQADPVLEWTAQWNAQADAAAEQA